MKSIRLLAPLTVLAGLFAPLCAQPVESEIPVEFRIDRKNSFAFGVRLIGGADVKFGNLGTIGSGIEIAALSAGEVARVYHDGAVSLDAVRTNELDADGNALPVVNGRYNTTSIRVDADGNQIKDENDVPLTQVSGDFLAYAAGQTRIWSYAAEAQATSNPGFIAFHEYSSVATGGAAKASSDAGPGFELTATHRFGRVGKLEIGLLIGGGLTDINGKTTGSVRANLITRTDLYSLKGAAAPSAPYTAPSFTDFTGADGTVYASGQETTTPLSTTPSSSTTVTTPNGADVSGTWQIKGAYYLFRVGPSLRMPISERFCLSASAGYAGAYVGTTYRVDETLNLPNGLVGINLKEEATYSKYMSGYYAEATGEFWLTPKTGFFLGATFEKLGNYSQTVGNRTAAIDVGGNSGLRFGITTRF